MSVCQSHLRLAAAAGIVAGVAGLVEGAAEGLAVLVVLARVGHGREVAAVARRLTLGRAAFGGVLGKERGRDLFVCLFVCMYVCLVAWLYVCMFVCLFVRL